MQNSHKDWWNEIHRFSFLESSERDAYVCHSCLPSIIFGFFWSYACCGMSSVFYSEKVKENVCVQIRFRQKNPLTVFTLAKILVHSCFL